MIDVDTFVTILYVMVDDFCQSHQFGEACHPGPAATLSCSEVVTEKDVPYSLLMFLPKSPATERLYLPEINFIYQGTTLFSFYNKCRRKIKSFHKRASFTLEYMRLM
jgi:hypothetical protein